MVDFQNDYVMTIAGTAVRGNASFDVINPATGKVIASAPDASPADLDAAVAAARKAFPAWSRTTIAERRDLLRAIGQRIKEHADDFMRLVTAEQGKPHSDARMEALGAAFWCSGVAKQELPVTVNEDTPERRSETRRVPLGVVGGIVPWNFPLFLGMWKIAPVLFTGNTVIVKPSPFTPLSLLKLGELVSDILPPGVFNVISGGDDLGPWMTGHPGIDKISFTGSTATGRRVMASASGNLKRLTLELGGNDAAIVLPDVEVATVAEKLFWTAFGNNGQVCTATKRLYIHEDIYDDLAEALVNYAKKVTVGDGAISGTQLGPIQNRTQYERIKDLIADARATGLRFLTGGDIPEGPGFFVPVTIIDNPPEDSRVVVEEAFGPVLPLLKFSDVDDVVERANNSIFGLGGSVWSADTEQAVAIASRLETGTVWVNQPQYLMPGVPFGGRKQSGLGVENGIEGLLEYTNVQTLNIAK